MIDPTPEDCDAAGQAVCEISGAGGEGGGGGSGGAGGAGGEGGAGGGPITTRCGFTALELCANCEVGGAATQEACVAVFDACLDRYDLGEVGEECQTCSVIALSECVETGGM